jgi:hypothetical protein
MDVTVSCCRCHREIHGIQNEHGTGGFYAVGIGQWATMSNPGEKIVCDSCMHRDLRYIAVYGPQAMQVDSTPDPV